mgnify:CR=1 FL=1
MTALKDLTGKRFGRLVVKEKLPSRKLPSGKTQVVWLCKCDCGKKHIVSGENLKSGGVKSCGCYAKEISSKVHKKHGLSQTKLFNVWHGIKKRCLTKSDKHYKDYGGRGITICDEWKNNFIIFYNWSMKNGYKDGLTIDRINNNGNYEPSNCRWTTLRVQANNRRSNVLVTYKGETLTLTQMARKYNISFGMLRTRLKKKIDIKTAITMPSSPNNRFF